MLTSPLGKRLGGAVCRVRHGPYVLNDDLCADDAGWVTVRIDHRLTYVVLEWAPREVPRAEGYPYRTHHWVALTDERDEAALRRLHNLGFDTRAGLHDGVCAFQIRYGHYPVTGDLDDIAEDLRTFHDEGRAPESKLEPAEPRGPQPPTNPEDLSPPLSRTHRVERRLPAHGERAIVPAHFVEEPPSEEENLPRPVPAQAPPAPPKITLAQHKKSTGQMAMAFKTVNKAITDGDALFEFVHIYSEWVNPQNAKETAWGFFWVFSDALMWEVPTSAPFDTWKGTGVEQPFPRNPHGGVKIGDRKRLIRLPVKGKQANRAVEQISVSQAELLAAAGSDLIEPDPDDKRVKCVLPTSRLYDIAYMRAPVKISPQWQKAMAHRERVFRYNEAVAKAIERSITALKAQNKKLGISIQPTALGTPGKIWSLDDGMDDWSCSQTDRKWLIACVNHGFHQGIRPAGNGAQKTTQIQTRGHSHSWEHFDYSQIFWAVAGWCLVKDVNETQARWRKTRAIYKDGTLFRLVRPLPPFSQTVVPALKYTGTTTNPKPTAPCP
jgi:hypothetical protein